jgi:hypothetical protein
MSYLYGDSTPSTLEVDFIDFLKEGLDLCVQLALSTDGLQRQNERGNALRLAARSDIERLENLGAAAAEHFSDKGDGPAGRCALAVIRSTSDHIRSEIQGVNSALEIEEAKLEVARTGERENCVTALEAFLLRHDLPSSSASLHLKARAGEPYAARLHTVTPLGVTATIELDVPSSHLFGHVIRVDRIVDHLEVRTPEVGGWLHKQLKMRTHRLEKLHVIELDLRGKESSVTLRASADGSGPGFDMLVRAEEPRVSLARVAERGSSDPPFEVDQAEADNLLALLEKLEASAQELMVHRKALLQASLDDCLIRDHDAPILLAERLVQAIAPVVRDIAVRSPSTTELVLKRLVRGGRREEIYVPKAELREKIERVPIAFRALFDPLDLGDECAGVPTANVRPISEAPRSTAHRASEPFPLAIARPASGLDTHSLESARPTSDTSKQDVTVEQIDAEFRSVILRDELPIAQ